VDFLVLCALPKVGLPVHTLRLAGERLSHVRSATELLQYSLAPTEGRVPVRLLLARVSQILTATTEEVAPLQVELRYPLATRYSFNHPSGTGYETSSLRPSGPWE
jgi:hypothetical protein